MTYNWFVFAPGCTDDIFSSDHSPVFATFEVGVTSQLGSKTGAVMVAQKTDELCLIPVCWPNSVVIPLRGGTDLTMGIEKAWIELEGIEAILKTSSKAKFFIELHSTCLEGVSLVPHPNGFSCLNCRQPTKHTVVSSYRDTALKCEWLAELQRYRVPQTGMVIQTTAKGYSFRSVWKCPMNTKR